MATKKIVKAKSSKKKVIVVKNITDFNNKYADPTQDDDDYPDYTECTFTSIGDDVFGSHTNDAKILEFCCGVAEYGGICGDFSSPEQARDWFICSLRKIGKAAIIFTDTNLKYRTNLKSVVEPIKLGRNATGNTIYMWIITKTTLGIK